MTRGKDGKNRSKEKNTDKISQEKKSWAYKLIVIKCENKIPGNDAKNLLIDFGKCTKSLQVVNLGSPSIVSIGILLHLLNTFQFVSESKIVKTGMKVGIECYRKNNYVKRKNY